MLNEQRRINEELMGQMRQMQMSMSDMRSRMSRGPGGYPASEDIGGFGSGYGEGYGGGSNPDH